MNDVFLSLPDEIITQIVLSIPDVKDIVNNCQINQQFNNILLNNEFWRLLFIRDFGQLDFNLVDKLWKSIYRDYGGVVAFGRNFYGQLGFSDGMDRDKFTKVPSPKMKFISCSHNYTAMIDIHNNVWCSGNNKSRTKLNDGTNRNVFTKISIPKAKSVTCENLRMAIIDMDDSVWTFEIEPVLESTNENIKAKQISYGYHHIGIIDLNDNVLIRGNNYHGQLGLGDNESRDEWTIIPDIKAKQLVCKCDHTILIDLNDNVWVFWIRAIRDWRYS